MMKTIFYLLAVLCLPLYSFAWGKTGHQIIAQIAMLYIDAGNRTRLQQLLGATPPEDAATWMDDIRNERRFDFMRPWHYINIDKGQPYPNKTEENIVTELTSAYLQLKHPQTLTPDQVKTAVMVLFHLVGDLHQPLHTGYSQDKGGNDVELRFIGKVTNLHSLWDGGLIDQQKISFISVRNSRPAFTKKQLKQVVSIDIVGWMQESRALLPGVYSFADNKVAESYAIRNKAVIEHQLLFAGVRLAAMLNDVLKSSTMKRAIDTMQTDTQRPIGPGAPAAAINVKSAAGNNHQRTTITTLIHNTDCFALCCWLGLSLLPSRPSI